MAASTEPSWRDCTMDDAVRGPERSLQPQADRFAGGVRTSTVRLDPSWIHTSHLANFHKDTARISLPVLSSAETYATDRPMSGVQQFCTRHFKTFVEFFGKQLDPDFIYEPNFSPRNYFSQYGPKDYIRVVVIVGAYALIIRPLLEKGMQKLKDRATAQGSGPQPIPVDLPAWQNKNESDEDTGLDWGARLRRKAREAQAKKDAEAEDNEMEDSELDKYLD